MSIQLVHNSISTNNMCVLPQMNVLMLIIIYIWTAGAKRMKFSCGVNISANRTKIRELAYIEMYPWMGVLMYPFSSKFAGEPSKTTVVLITSHLVLTTALEIDNYPKHDFRENSRVVLGHSIRTGPYIRVVQYILHPDYNMRYYSTIALVQIEPTVKQTFELVPICGPPKDIIDSTIYAMTLVDGKGSSHSLVKIYEMEYIENDQCKDFYRRYNLNMDSLWPRHAACARGIKSGHCLFQSGTLLVNKQHGKWHLLGLGIYGPGCEAPARFLEYNMYISWIRDSVSKIGRVTITRLGKGDLILRRSTSILNRYGPCDMEETRFNFYNEYVVGIMPPKHQYNSTLVYNVTLFGRIDYTCIALRAWYDRPNKPMPQSPELKIRKWCFSDTMLCASSQYTTLFFHVIIHFSKEMQYKFSFYGKPIKRTNAKRILWWANQRRTKPTMPMWSEGYQDPFSTTIPEDGS